MSRATTSLQLVLYLPPEGKSPFDKPMDIRWQVNRAIVVRHSKLVFEFLQRRVIPELRVEFPPKPIKVPFVFFEGILPIFFLRQFLGKVFQCPQMVNLG